jgi:two-component system chemotaxis response regulator CheB
MADTGGLRRDIVVVGASSGGVPMLLDLAEQLPPRFPAAVLIVQHIGAHPSVLPELLRDSGPNPAVHPVHGQMLEHGTLYVAPPDRHMLLDGNRIRLTHDAKENHARPAIDPLFRSAAIAHGPRVIGTLLSGRLDDGTAGLQAIKACGGLAVVQDPADALEPGMPRSAMDNVAVDHVVTQATLASTLHSLVQQTPGPSPGVPPQLMWEHRLSICEGDAMENLDAIGTPSKIVCPDCNGVLWELADTQPQRYRCHTGHAYTAQTLVYTQSTRVDEALWSALRALEEREYLLRGMAHAHRNREGGIDEATSFESEAEHVARHARQLQEMVGRE